MIWYGMTLQEATTVSGTRSHHCFIPDSDKKLRVLRISGDASFYYTNVVKGKKTAKENDPPPHLTVYDYQPGQYLACSYDGKWWVGNIQEICMEEKDLKVSFMHPHGPSKSFKWPGNQDVCWVPVEAILSILKPPATRHGRIYTLDQRDTELLLQK